MPAHTDLHFKSPIGSEESSKLAGPRITDPLGGMEQGELYIYKSSSLKSCRFVLLGEGRLRLYYLYYKFTGLKIRSAI